MDFREGGFAIHSQSQSSHKINWKEMQLLFPNLDVDWFQCGIVYEIELYLINCSDTTMVRVMTLD